MKASLEGLQAWRKLCALAGRLQLLQFFSVSFVIMPSIYGPQPAHDSAFACCCCCCCLLRLMLT
jgi:hypothetical protein